MTKRFIVDDLRDKNDTDLINAMIIDTDEELPCAKFRVYSNAIDFCNYLNYLCDIKNMEEYYHKKLNEELTKNLRLEQVNTYLIDKVYELNHRE